jgi:soluble lytic murein transglycosylase-like protein
MADKLGASPAEDQPVGIRHELERRVGNRRACARGTAERRRRDRRRARLRSLLFTALALATPHQLKNSALKTLTPDSGARVSTSIDSIVAVQPRRAYDALIREAAAIYGVDEAIIRSIMQAESAFDPSAVSRAGAMGLMQLMPAIAEAFGVENPFDPRQNIMAGTRLLRELLDQHRGNLRLAIASYNAGPTAIARYGNRVPPFRETQGYVKKVTNLIADARSGADDD